MARDRAARDTVAGRGGALVALAALRRTALLGTALRGAALRAGTAAGLRATVLVAPATAILGLTAPLTALCAVFVALTGVLVAVFVVVCFGRAVGPYALFSTMTPPGVLVTEHRQ